MTKTACSVLVSGLVLSLANGALGAEVSWTAPEECPAADTIHRDLEELAGITLSRAPALRFVATVQRQTGTRWHVALQITNPDGTSGNRTIEGPNCSDVSRAAVVAMALALNATDEAAPPSSEPEASSPPKKPEPPPPSEPIDGDEFREPPGSERPSPPPFGLLHAGAVLDGSAMPDLAGGATLAGGIGYRNWRVLLGGTLLPAQETSQGTVGARFFFAAGGPQACYRVGLGGWSLLPCLGYEIGALQGEGVRLTTPRERTALWQAARAELGVALPLAAHFELNLAGALVAPLTRPSFVLDAAVPVHEAPALGVRGHAGLTWLFGALETETTRRGQSMQ